MINKTKSIKALGQKIWKKSMQLGATGDRDAHSTASTVTVVLELAVSIKFKEHTNHDAKQRCVMIKLQSQREDTENVQTLDPSQAHSLAGAW